jgi:Domain of unknown function (DUF2382)
VTFEDLGSGRTRVTASIEYEPEGFVEKAGDALGIPSGRVEGDLKRFRDFIEERGRETGGWRGQIEGSEAEFRPRAAGAVLGTADEPLEAESGLERPARSALGGERYAMTEEPLPEEQARVGARTRGQEGDIAAQVPLAEEQVKVGKRTVEAGEVKLRKKVTTEQVNVPDTRPEQSSLPNLWHYASRRRPRGRSTN